MSPAGPLTAVLAPHRRFQLPCARGRVSVRGLAEQLSSSVRVTFMLVAAPGELASNERSGHRVGGC